MGEYKLAIQYDMRLGCESYPFTPEQLCVELHKIFKKFVFQKEKGSDTGYVHFQIRGSLFAKRRQNQAFELANKVFDLKSIGDNYFCRSATPSLGDNFYVMKDDTRIDGPWDDKYEPPYIPKQYRVTLRPWQEFILNSAENWEPRTINVIIDPIGNHGKSIVSGVAKCRGFYIYPSTLDANRLQETVCNELMSKKERQPKLMFFDLPRAQNKKALAALFTSIEVIKSGIVSDTRYTYKSWLFDSPVIWVMTNQDIEVAYLSRDRWKVWKFTSEGRLVRA